MQYDVIVIGGGAAGLMCAATAGQRGRRVLVIEHVIKAIKSLSDRLLVLHHGEKIADGDPETVLANQAVVEAYLGKRRA